MLSPAELGHHPAVLSCLPACLAAHTHSSHKHKQGMLQSTHIQIKTNTRWREACTCQTDIICYSCSQRYRTHTHTQVHIHFITFTVFASTHCELHSCMVKSSFSHLLPFNKHKFEFLSALFLRGLHTTVHQKPRAASWTHMQRKCGTFRENLFTNTNCRK